MKYVECPEVYNDTDLSLFLGGGITDCPDWQAEITNKLSDIPLVLLNPRRPTKPDDSYEQIKWEFDHLEKADLRLFWFCKETLCPIVLFELGKWIHLDKTPKGKLLIGIDKGYERLEDVVIQTNLVRDDVKIVHSLEEIAGQIKDLINANV